MVDWRRYTGTQRMQLCWSVVALGALVAVVSGSFPLPTEFGVIVISVSWFVGLVSIGLLDRYYWNELVRNSPFEPAAPTREIDLERLFHDRSVYAETTVPSVFAQTQLRISTLISDVDASFTVTLTYVGTGGTTSGTQTGVESLDEAFRLEGREENVSQILSRDVATALLAVETPGRCTVTGEEVSYTVPFTHISPAELDAISEAVVAIARQVESVGKS